MGVPRLAPRWLLYKVGPHCKHLGLKDAESLCRIDSQIAKSAFTRVVSFCHHGLLSAELDRDTHELAVLHACVVGCIVLLPWKVEFRWIYITILYVSCFVIVFDFQTEATTVKVASQAKHLNWKGVESRWPWDAVSLVIRWDLHKEPYTVCLLIHVYKVSYIRRSLNSCSGHEDGIEDWLAVASRVLGLVND